jgi:hypothetical protein
MPHCITCKFASGFVCRLLALVVAVKRQNAKSVILFFGSKKKKNVNLLLA